MVVSYALWILTQSSEVLIYFWYVTLIFTILLALSLFLINKRKQRVPKIFWYILYPVLLPFVIALLGSVFSVTNSNFAVYLIWVLLLIDIVCFIFLLVKMDNYRLFIFSLVGLLVFFTFSVILVALMSITNEWL